VSGAFVYRPSTASRGPVPERAYREPTLPSTPTGAYDPCP
jgi:hypothetical protein